MVEHVRLGESATDISSTPVSWTISAERSRIRTSFIYDVHKGFWAHHNKLMPDVV